MLERVLPRNAVDRRYWKISPGEGAKYWREFRDGGLIAVGWDGVPDLATSGVASQEALRTQLVPAGAAHRFDPGVAAKQLWYFSKEMQPGDLVCAYGGKQILGWGEITGAYAFADVRNGLPYRHHRPVTWRQTRPIDTDRLSPDLKRKLQLVATIIPLSEAEFGQITAEGATVRDKLRAELARQGLSYTPWQLATFYTALQTKGFVVLSGISGTGKSKLPQSVAGLFAPMPSPSPSPPAVAPIPVTVRQYMRDGQFFVIPVRAYPLFPLPALGEAGSVNVYFGNEVQQSRIRHRSISHRGSGESPRGAIAELMLRGPLGTWFVERFEVESQFFLTPVLRHERVVGVEISSRIDEAPLEDQDLNEGVSAGSLDRLPAPQQKIPAGDQSNALFLAVRPDWRDSKSLLGYHNPLTQTYEWTPFLRFLLRAAESHKRNDGDPFFVILDEMNLAHVEYYFADLLSVLESGRDAEGWTREALRLGEASGEDPDPPPDEIRLPPNLFIVGTVNVDETTHAFSPKVLDRAFTLELTDVDFRGYPPVPAGIGAPGLDDAERQALVAAFTRNGRFARIDKGEIAAYVATHPGVRDRLQTLNVALRPFNLHFGYRVFDEIVAFLAAAEENGLFAAEPGPNPAFDAAVLMKVLPKFHGSRAKLEKPLRAVLAWCLTPDDPDRRAVDAALDRIEDPDEVLRALNDRSFVFPVTADRVRRMLGTLATDGFAAFG